MVISLLSNSSIALELLLNSPNKVEVNEEFQVSIDLDSQDLYDIKVFAHNSQDEGVSRDEYISEIFNTEKDDWQSSWNYLSRSFPNEDKYKFKILKSPGERQICVRVRKSGADASISKCNSIIVADSNKIGESTDNNAEIDNENKGENEESSKNNKNDKQDEENGPVVDNLKNINPLRDSSQNTQEDISISSSINENTQIILNSQKKDQEKIKNLEGEIYTTKKQKTTLFVFYIFNLFLMFIIVLVIFKKL